MNCVSVPYWGSLYFNNYNDDSINGTQLVSVPYWGSLYFNVNKRIKELTSQEFPSPIGVLYISITLRAIKLPKEEVKVSVPYWGSLYFNPVLRSPYNYRAAKPDCGAKPNPAFTI